MVFGGGNVGGILIHPDDDTKRAAVRRAFDGGVNWIDTAVSYGQGKSEESLGWLQEEVDDTPFLSTKFRIDLERNDDIAGQIEESLHASLKRLRRESVDLFQLHNHIAPEAGGRALSVDHVLGKGGVADGLDRMRDQGLIRHFGITALNDAASCRQVIESGRIDSAQVYYNILNPSAGRSMPAGWTGQDLGGLIGACHDNGVAVMVIRVLAAGVLATDDRTGRESVLTKGTDLSSEERKAKAVAVALGSEHGTRAQTAIRFALANPQISCVVVGMAELDHLEEALAAFEMGPLPAAALARLDELYETDFGRLEP